MPRGQTMGAAAPIPTAPPSLYRDLAAQMLKLIRKGAFRPGDRIPSVRGLSRQKAVSVTTVLEAYRLLEDDGHIEARPQSGYFVRARLIEPPEEPRRSSPSATPRDVSTRDLIAMILRDSQDPGLVQLGAGFPPMELLPTERLNRSLARVARRPRQRSIDSPEGSLELRTQIARRALDAGVTVTPDELIVTNGCREGIYYALAAICKPGDTVAVESPTFYGFLQAIDHLGLRVLEVPTYPRDGICLDEVEAAIGRHRISAFLLTPTFNNPIGSLMPDAKKEALVRILSKRRIPMIEDDIAGDLGHAPTRPRAAKAFDRDGTVILCSSFSKTLAPGYRVGWVAPGPFHEKVLAHKWVNNLSNSTLPQLAIADFLANGGYDHYLRKVRRLYANNVCSLTETIRDSFPEGTRVSRPAGGFVLWVELPKGIDSLKLYERAVAAGVTMTPGSIFSAKGLYKNFIRLSAARWNDRTKAGVRTLGKLAASRG